MRRSTSSKAARSKELDHAKQSRQRHERSPDIRQCRAAGLIKHPSGQNAARAVGQLGDPFLLAAAVALADNLKLFAEMRMVAVTHPLEFREVCIL
jgi:hypothetical protein